MDYEGLYQDLRTMCQRAEIRSFNAMVNGDDARAREIFEFEKQCWEFRNELRPRA